MIARERRRLRWVFRGALAAALASAGCSSGSDEAQATTGGGGGDDASTGPGDAGLEAAGDGGDEADEASSACDPVDDPELAELCGYPRLLPCGLPANAGPVTGCHLSLDDCYAICNSAVVYDCAAWAESCADGGIVSGPGPLHVDCTICLGGPGRRPDGLAPPARDRRASPLGRALAEAAHLERAAIVAFARLGADLRALGAPRRLVALARRCARDELEHTATMTSLAREHGATTPRPRVPRREGDRPLDEVALENAVEGCVGETYAALVAAWQASHAADPAIARAMRTIARDELRHAAFAWAIARWADARLDEGARRRVRSARAKAVEALRRSASAAVDPVVVQRAGLPPAAVQRALVERLERELWS